MPSKATVLHILVCPLLPPPSLHLFLFDLKLNIRICLLKRLEVPFIFSQLLEEQQLRHLTWKKKILSKYSFGFKYPLQRSWNHLPWTLRRQKKVIAWVSHYLQQGAGKESLRIQKGCNRAFPAYGSVGGEVRAPQAPLGHSHPFLDHEHSPHQHTLLVMPWWFPSVVLSFLPLMP